MSVRQCVLQTAFSRLAFQPNVAIPFHAISFALLAFVHDHLFFKCIASAIALQFKFTLPMPPAIRNSSNLAFEVFSIQA
jgi:hypothetical protein